MKPERVNPVKNQRIDKGTVSRHRRDKNNLRNFSENPDSFYTSGSTTLDCSEFSLPMGFGPKKL